MYEDLVIPICIHIAYNYEWIRLVKYSCFVKVKVVIPTTHMDLMIF